MLHCSVLKSTSFTHEAVTIAVTFTMERKAGGDTAKTASIAKIILYTEIYAFGERIWTVLKASTLIQMWL